MSPFAAYPTLASMPIRELTENLRQSCIEWLALGNDPAQLLDLIDGVVDKEQYEMAQAIVNATQDFARNPQLALF